MGSTPGAGGFTLIEMMITVAIIAILSGIALPNYREYVNRSHRANARNTLIQAAQWMERAATATGTYPVSTASPSQIPSGILKVEGDRYTVTVVSTASTFTITATRKPGTGQASDKCGDYRLDQANRRDTVPSTRSASMTDADCWNR
ncbi:MAG: type IV pilin protein [Rhodoferax sp.]|nr:type IV pilin protein [Rhodoferax sp.]